MATMAGAKKPPVHRLAWLGFVLALVSLGLAFYGSLYAEKHLADSPLHAARGTAGIPTQPTRWYERVIANGETTVFGDRLDRYMVKLTAESKAANYTLQFFAFVLPFFMGIAAALVGGWAMSVIEREGGKYGGNPQGVFSILIGMFAAVIAGCMLSSLHLWPLVGSPYTA